jgi:hypothetical protein
MTIMYPINNPLVKHLNLNNKTDRQFALCESCFWSATIFKSKVKNSIITLGVMSSMFLVNGKTGSRDIPLIQSISYIKEWLSNHPSRNNLKSPLFVSLDNWANRRFSYRYFIVIYYLWIDSQKPSLWLLLFIAILRPLSMVTKNLYYV